MSTNTCSFCSEEVTIPILCVNCKKPFHDTCGLYKVKSPLNEECNLCSLCQLPDISLALKRRKADLEELHKNFVTENSNQFNNSEVINNQPIDSSDMIVDYRLPSTII